MGDDQKQDKFKDLGGTFRLDINGPQVSSTEGAPAQVRQPISAPAPSPNKIEDIREATNPDEAAKRIGEGFEGTVTGGLKMLGDIVLPPGKTEGERLKYLGKKYVTGPLNAAAAEALKQGPGIQQAATVGEALPGVGPMAVAPIVEPIKAASKSPTAALTASQNLAGQAGALTLLAPAFEGAKAGAEGVVSGLGETAQTALGAAGEEVGNMARATAPEGSTEAGRVKLNVKGKAPAVTPGTPAGVIEDASNLPGMQRNTEFKNPKDPTHVKLEGPANVELSENNGNLRIKAIEVPEESRRQGQASKLLTSLTDLADKHGVKTELTASPYAALGETGRPGKEILDADELKSFYERHGFVQEPGSDPAYGYMIREPQPAEAAPAVPAAVPEIISGDDVVKHVTNTDTTAQRLTKQNKPQDAEKVARSLVGLDAGGNYKRLDIPVEDLVTDKSEDPELVQKYANQKGPLPEIVLDIDGKLRDGNHRVAAAQLRGDKTVKAYVPLDSTSGKVPEWAQDYETAAAPAAEGEPTIEHHENVEDVPGAPMNRVVLKQGDKEMGRLNYVINGDTASVKTVGVEPPLRGKGYAQQMYKRAADEIKAAHPEVKTLTSDLQGSTNEKATGVWDSLANQGHPIEKIASTKKGSSAYSWDLTKPQGAPKPVDFSEVGGTTVKLPSTLPNAEVAASANRYNGARGGEEINHAPGELTSPEKRAALADKYEALQHNPNDPAVQKAYAAMKKETLDQYNHAKSDLGINFEFTPENPYENAEQMTRDVRQNKHLAVYTGGNELPAGHPQAEIEPTTGQSYNNLFRATHDVYGHAAGGNEFTEAGEENAFRAHSQMYSPEARPAVQNETQGQSNWYFNNKAVREGKPMGDFAEQKAAVLPQNVEPSEEDTSFGFGANAAAVQAAGKYHPDLQKIADKYGVKETPSGSGGSFITPDGKFIRLSGTEHPEAIRSTLGNKYESYSEPWKTIDNRIPFANETGSVQVRAHIGRDGQGISIRVPKQGVTPEQIDAIKAETKAAVGRGGRLVMERVDVTPETQNTLTKTVEYGNANNIEPMLRDIQAHPDKTAPGWHETAGAQAAKEPAGGIDPHTGKSDEKGIGAEFMPEVRQNLDHAPTPKDFQDFYEKNKALFDADPSLRVGWDNNSKVPGGHEINIAATGKGAVKMARKLDQRAAFDIGKNEEIPTGGEGLQTKFPNYPVEERLNDLHDRPQSNIPKFENVPQRIYDRLTPDARKYLADDPKLQQRMMAEIHKEPLTEGEAVTAAAASSDINGWWRRFSDIHDRIGDAGPTKTNQYGVRYGDISKAFHSALSGNKLVEDANNLAWGSMYDWLKAGEPTDRASIDAIIRANGAAEAGELGPNGLPKKGNAAMSDTLNSKGKVTHENLDTTELWRLVNSPEMRGEKPFNGNIWSETSPIEAKGAQARKLPSMLATTAGGDLQNAVVDSIMGRFMGRKKPSLVPATEAKYLADSVFLRGVGDTMKLPTGEAQEQIWTTTQAFLNHIKNGLTPEQAADKIIHEGTYSTGKDYADIILNDPEVSGKGGYLDKLKNEFGIGPGSDGIADLHRQTRAAQPPKESTAGPLNKADLTATGERIRGTLNEDRIKKPTNPDLAPALKASMEGLKKPGRDFSQYSVPSNFLKAPLEGLSKPGAKIKK